MTGAVLSDRVRLERLVWVGPLAAVLAMAGVTAVRYAAAALLAPDPRFLPLTPGGPAVFAFGGAVAAIAVFDIVGRTSRRPIWLYVRISVAALLVSFVLPISLLFTNSIPGTTVGGVAALALMHVVAWAAIVLTLTRLARR